MFSSVLVSKIWACGLPLRHYSLSDSHSHLMFLWLFFSSVFCAGVRPLSNICLCFLLSNFSTSAFGFYAHLFWLCWSEAFFGGLFTWDHSSVSCSLPVFSVQLQLFTAVPCSSEVPYVLCLNVSVSLALNMCH